MSSSRRDFLKQIVGTTSAVSLAPAVPAFLARAVRAAGRQPDRAATVLVVLQLSGGNDGLNSVVPYDDDVYGRARRTLRLTGRQVHRIDDQLGFHPALRAFWQLYQEGLLSVVQGVGYPNSNRSHDPAMRDWHTARPGETACQTGWVGRTVDAVSQSDPVQVPSVFVGPIATPFALNAERSVVPSVRTANEWTLNSGAGPWAGSAGAASRSDAPTGGNPLEDHVRRTAAAVLADSRRVEAVLRDADRVGDYPPLGLAKRLKTIAQLIRAELGIRIFFAELGGGGIGGFDNHANQRDNHAALLRQLSESVAAFVRDLKQAGLLDRVVLMTFSEFGRTVSENGRRGTDHGAAAPVFVVGGGLRGGLVGPHPSLADLEGDAQKHHTDFRRVYATMLDRWLGIDSQPILGKRYRPVEVFA